MKEYDITEEQPNWILGIGINFHLNIIKTQYSHVSEIHVESIDINATAKDISSFKRDK